jgi:WD40 repeat protein
MSFYVTGGSLQSDAPSYVERQADRDLLTGLLEGEFCYVLTARQMGKSSLMVRTATRLRQAGIRVAALDLTAIGGQNVSPDQWYHGLLDTLGQELDLEDELEVFWQANAHLGSLHRLMKALRQIVLGRLGGDLLPDPALDDGRPLTDTEIARRRTTVRLVIFVDEIDFVRSLPFPVDEFFAAIRECYNHRSLDPGYRRLTFCLLGVASPSDLIRDTRTTPFNIGRRIELNDFTREEAAPLAQGLQTDASPLSARQATELLSRILYWTEGHPYLTQKLCRVTDEALQKTPTGESRCRRMSEFVDRICADLFLSHRARERDDNLVFVRERLLRNESDGADLLEFYLKVWSGKRVADDELDPLVAILRLSGVVRVCHGRLRERNPIYARVFDAEWVRSNMPEADLRRQREAYKKGVIWAASVSSLVVLAVILVGVLLRDSSKLRIASAVASFGQAQLLRSSGRAGQCIQSLEALRKAREHFPDRALLRNEAIACMALADLEPITNAFRLPKGTAMAAIVDGTTLSLADEQGKIGLVQIGSSTVVQQPVPEQGPVAWLALSSDSRYLAAQYARPGEPRLIIWDCEQHNVILSFTNQISRLALDFSSDHTKVALGVPGGTISVYSLPDGHLLSSISKRTVTDEPRGYACLRFDPAGTRIAEASTNSTSILVYSLRDVEHPQTLSHRSSGVILAWHPDGQHLVVASEHGDLWWWNLVRLKQTEIARAHSGAIAGLTFNHDGDLLASLGEDRLLKLWTSATLRQVVAEFDGDPKGQLAFSPDDRCLFHVALPVDVQRWRIEKAEEYRALPITPAVNSSWRALCFGADGRVLVTGDDAGVYFWDTQAGRELGFIQMTLLQSAFLDPVRGDLFVSAAEGFYFWPRLKKSDPPGGDESDIRFGPAEPFNLPPGLRASAFSSSSRRVAVIHERHAHIACLDNPLSATVLPIRGNFASIGINASGDWLATLGEEDLRLSLWSTRPSDQSPSKAFTNVQQYAFTPDGQGILIEDQKGFQLWKLGTWRSSELVLPEARRGPPSGPLALAQLDSGHMLLAISLGPDKISLFELTVEGGHRPTELATLESPDRKPLVAICLSPDGRRLAATTADQVIELWDLARLQSSLAVLQLEGQFRPFEARSGSIHRVAFSSAQVDPAKPRLWEKVERFNASLADTNDRPQEETAADLFGRGQSFRELGLTDRAIQDFQEMLKLNLADQQAKDSLNSLLPSESSLHP